MTQTVLLKDICKKISSGGTPNTQVQEYWGGDLPWLSSGETNQRYIYSTEKRITQSGVNNSSTRLAKKGSIVIASAGQGKTRGQASMLMLDTYINQSVIEIRPDSSRVNPDFLFAVLSSMYERLRALSDAESVRGSLTTKILGNIKLELPEMEVQVEIGSLLRLIDENIELNRKMNVTLEQIGKAVFRNYFIENPEAVKWKVGIFSDVADVLTGKGSTKSHLSNSGGIPLYGANGVMGTSEDYLYNESLIVTGRVGTLGKVRAVTGKAWFSDNVLIMKPRVESFGYVYHLAQTFDYISMNRGSTQPLITQTDLRKQRIRIPDDTVLKNFEKQFSNLFELQQKNDRQTHAYITLRDTLLPRLISRKITQ